MNFVFWLATHRRRRRLVRALAEDMAADLPLKRNVFAPALPFSMSRTESRWLIRFKLSVPDLVIEPFSR